MNFGTKLMGHGSPSHLVKTNVFTTHLLLFFFFFSKDFESKFYMIGMDWTHARRGPSASAIHPGSKILRNMQRQHWQGIYPPTALPRGRTQRDQAVRLLRTWKYSFLYSQERTRSPPVSELAGGGGMIGDKWRLLWRAWAYQAHRKKRWTVWRCMFSLKKRAAYNTFFIDTRNEI